MEVDTGSVVSTFPMPQKMDAQVDASSGWMLK